MVNVHPAILVSLALLFGACKDGDEGATETAGTSSGSTSTAPVTSGDDCSPGIEGCPCTEEGLCIVGLLCLSDLCVEPPPPMTSGPMEGGETSAGEGTSDSAGEETGAAGACFTNDECAEDEVCFEGYCTWASFLQYEVTVTSFVPPSCRDGIGSAEVIYWAYLNSEVAHQSAEAACPASWFDETFLVHGLDVLELAFWESDGFADDPFTRLCWQQWEDGVCSEPPSYVFHNYGFDGLTGDGIYAFSFSAFPVAWCGYSCE
jgi:hypothetical protein